MADDLTDEERVIFGNQAIAANLARGCRELREMDVSTSSSALDIAANFK